MSLNLSWVTDELAIGGSFPCDAIERLAREHTVAAVVDLREEACDDETQLAAHGIAFLHLPTVDHAAVSTEMLRAGVTFVGEQLAAGKRVLVHCEHGIGRSALLALCVLVARGHAPVAALTLAKDRRARVSPSPAQLEAWLQWLAAHRTECSASWAVPTFDELAAIAYRHLRREAG